MALAAKHDAILSIEQSLNKTLKPKGIEKFLGLEKTATELCCSLILNYFQECGLNVSEGKKFSFQDLYKVLEVVPKYHKMVQFFLFILSSQDIVEIQKKSPDFVFTPLISSVPHSEKILKKIAGIYPKFHSFFSFLDHCTKHYSEVLSGKIPGVNIIFPSGDSSTLEKIYQTTPQVGHEHLYLNVLRETLLLLAEKKLDILEIGGGQGILTDILLPFIRSSVGQYYFTDIGQTFLYQGQQKYKHLPQGLMKFAVYDVSASTEEQGFRLSSFDVLVGFNVLHATEDIGKSLKKASTLLKENGYFLLVENTKQQIWIDMIYGLTDGWWAFDDGIREISPLLTREQWHCLLKNNGFNDFIVFPEQNEKHDLIDTSLIVIQKPKMDL